MEAVPSGEACLDRVTRGPVDLIVLDVWLPGMDGLATLARLRERQVDAQVVLISGHGNIESAVRAIKMGAFDFVEKPLSLEKTVLVVRNALRQRRLEAENQALRARVDRTQTMVGESYAMRQLREQVAMAAPTNGRVLIYGENGTGKELVARTVHALSRRRNNAWVEVNCAAIPEELIESELFGHVRGAFTGAVADRRGKFEVADGGTIFLDEIGDMSLKTQAKVLRVLQEQTMEAVGGTARIRVDARVLAATNKDLQAEIRAGNFREDLYFRLNVIPIFVPPLRERQEDIPLLAEHFMSEFSREYGRRLKTFDAGAIAALQRYAWPGNVRELRNVIERLTIMAPGDAITGIDVAFLQQNTVGRVEPPEQTAGRQTLHEARDQFERDLILRTLAEQQGNMSKTAEVLGVERSNLYRKMRAFGIAPSRRPEPEEEAVVVVAAVRRSAFGVRRAQPVFQHLFARESSEPQVVLGCVGQGRGRNEPDNLAFEHFDAVARRFPPHHLEHAKHRRLLVVRQVHRHLDDAAVLQRHAHRLDVAEAAGAEADRGRDLLRHVEPVGRQVDVVGDERHSRADHGGARRGMRLRTAEVRGPSFGRHFSPPALRTRRGGCPRGCGAQDWPTPLRTDTRAPRIDPPPRRRLSARAPRNRPSSPLRSGRTARRRRHRHADARRGAIAGRCRRPPARTAP